MQCTPAHAQCMRTGAWQTASKQITGVERPYPKRNVPSDPASVGYPIFLKQIGMRVLVCGWTNVPQSPSGVILAFSTMLPRCDVTVNVPSAVLVVVTTGGSRGFHKLT